MTEQRDYKQEGDNIKRDLTQPLPFSFEFTSAIESVYPGFAPYKICASQVTRFVPDFFYLGDISVKLFDSLKGDRLIQKNDDYCPFGFTAYIFYAAFAHLVRSLASYENVGIEIIQINTIFENAGFLDVPIPLIFSQWFQAIGNFKSNIFGRNIRPSYVNYEMNGNYFDNYFFSGQTAHLLPNFRALYAKAVLLSNDNTFAFANIQRNNQTFITPSTPIQVDFLSIQNAQLFRAYNSRIPGIAHLTRRQVSPQFASLAAQTLSTNYTGQHPLVRSLQLRPQMLRHLATTYTQFCKMFDHFMTSKNPNSGTDLLECYLVEQLCQEPIFGSVLTETEPPIVVTPAIFDHVFKIKSKYNIVNGYMLTASIVPAIRLSNEQTRVPNDITNPQDPGEVQDEYFNSAHEYESMTLTIQEAHARFSRKK